MARKCKKCGCKIERGVCLNCGEEDSCIRRIFFLIIAIGLFILAFLVR